MTEDFRSPADDRVVRSGSRDSGVQPVRGRGGRRIMVGLVTIAVVLGFGVVMLYAYNKGKQDAQGNAPPVIQAKEGPSKVRPESPGGMNVPNRDKEIFSRLEANGNRQKTEELLPTPEKPLGPPKPGEVVQTGSAVIAPPAGGDTAAKGSERPPLKLEKAAPPPPPVVKKAPAPKKKVPVSKAATPAAVTLTGGRYRVQISSLRSEASVRRSWPTIWAQNKDILKNLSLIIERTQVAGKGTFYRMQAGRLQTRAQAVAICGRLMQRKVSCIVVRR